MKYNKYFADDRPLDYRKYMDMTEEEIDEEIERLEKEEKQRNTKKELLSVWKTWSCTGAI